MPTSFTSPFDAIFTLQRALDAQHQSDWFGSGTAGTGAFPPINIFQQDDDFVAIVELAGVDKVDLQIEAKESTIRISGKKEIGFETSASIHRRERTYGRFRRAIALPDGVDYESVRAEMKDGVLEVYFPLPQPRTERKKIEISGGESSTEKKSVH